jgi:hypothetical protein
MMQVHELKETSHDAFKKHTKAIIGHNCMGADDAKQCNAIKRKT